MSRPAVALVITTCVAAGLALGLLIGFLVNDARTIGAVGSLVGLAVGFALTGRDATTADGERQALGRSKVA